MKRSHTVIKKSIELTRKLIGTKNAIRLKTVVSIVRRPIYKVSIRKKIVSLASEIRIAPPFYSLDYNPWNNSFKKMMLQSNESRFLEMIYEFYKNPLKLCKMHDLSGDGPVVVCALKNELTRLHEFYRHYRSLGVKDFIMIDNNSSDGTLDFLINQSDTAVFFTDRTYNSKRKTGWINKAISYYGIEQWYVIVDADEFLVYPEMSDISIIEYVKELKARKIYSVKTLMLEMYPNAPFFDDLRSPENFVSEYCYFDIDGKLHERLFDARDNNYRWKVSLLYYDGNRFVTGSHDFYPFNEYIECRWGGIVLHYKFLSDEKKKIKKIVNEGMYANNSSLYKKYKAVFDEKPDLNPYYDGSRKWEGAESFKYFKFIEQLTK